MELNEQNVQDYLKKKFEGRDSFLANIIFPIFGEENFEEGFDAELLDDPDVKHDAEKVGIRSIITYGRIGIDLGSVQIFDITVTDHVLLARNRVTVQGIIRRILGTFQGAFMIFHYEDTDRWDWRFSFCCKGDKEITEAKRFTFLLGPNQSCRTAAQNFVKLAQSASASASPTMDDIKKAFDVEALSNEFFAKYKNYYEQIVKYITGKCFKKVGGKWKEVSDGVPNEAIYNEFGHDDKAVRDYVKKLLGRIVFLHFLQKKGWLGAKKSWADGDREFMLHLYQLSSKKQKDDFLDAVLEPLFDQALDVDRSSCGDMFDTHVSGVGKVKIPYLNGGLFTRDAADEKTVRLPCDYFRNFLVFLSEYNFTIDENDPSDAEVGVDPEMLSRIFENLLEDNKDKGAIYTPKPIVEYMCRESLSAYLKTDMPEKDHVAIDEFVKTNDPAKLSKKLAAMIDKKLKGVKICDPAIGSGAFPMGMLRELYFCRTALEDDLDGLRPAEIKRQIIQENIYGVDIEKGAVDIARLRFWLSLVVDEESPHTLPNLDFKIMQGNSLLENYKGVPLDSLLVGKVKKPKKVKQARFDFDTRESYTQDELALGSDSASKAITSLMGEYYATDNRDKKQRILSKINDQVKGYIKGQINNSDLTAEIDALECQNDKFFLWHTWFADVFEKGGFDIVIGNPPYIDSETMTRIMPDLRAIYAKLYSCASGNWDMFVAFSERGLKLLNSNGVFSFIVPNKLLAAPYASKLRMELIRGNRTIEEIRDYASVKVFREADVYPITLVIANNSANKPTRFVKMNSESEVGQNMAYTITPQPIPWDIGFQPFHIGRIVVKCLVERSPIMLLDGIDISDAATVSEAYKIVPVIKDVADGHGFKFINTGTIDPYVSLWGRKRTQYIKHSFTYPRVAKADLMNISKRRTSQAESAKIIIAGMSNRLEAFHDPGGDFIAGKSTVVVLGEEGCLTWLTGVLNSKLINFCVRNAFSSLRMAGGYINVSPAIVELIGQPNNDPKIKVAISKLVNTILAAKKKDPASDTSKWEAEIDEKVFDLYGLTPDEREIVKGGGK